MPIPHLSHKIHSPNNWKRGRVLEKKKKPGPSRKRGFFNFKKQVERLADIRLSPRRGGFNFNPFKFFKRYFKQIAALVLILVIGLIGLFAWLSKDLPDPNKLTEREVAQSTKIYDRTGEHLLYEIHGEQKRTIIRLEEVPAYAIQATLALEDQRFYEHRGFNLWGIFRGVVIRALTGKSLQGGSTLTQQLVKNAIVGDTRTVTRKLKELVLAYRIERKYSKDEILQMYFNEIPYGSTAYGIEAAATYYFAKSSKDLTLAEAAVLAALPQAPSYYSPWGSHIDELFGRQKYALDQMVKEGYITREQADVAKAEEITFANRIEGIEAPHFVFFVKELLAEKYGEKVIEQSGYKIISTLDYDLQKKAEAIITEQVKKNLTSYNAGNASLVAIDVKTGQILAMVGSKDFFDEDIDGQVNVAVAPRQPGSSFKPVVYATAFSRGFVPETVVYDLETVFPVFDGDYIPHDYDLKERGPVSLRTALAGSLNIPAVKMIYLAGIDNVLDLADSLEYSTFRDRSRFGLSLVLGGGEVKLLEHTNAYATFARDGKKMKYSSVLRLEDNLGKAMEEFNQPSTQKVLEPEIARMVTDILADNEARTFIFGASNYLTLGDRPVAAKTGTTNDYHDAWTLGYTPQLAVGVWVGNSDNAEMKRGADGSVVAAPIWQKFMTEAMAGRPVESFHKPSYEIPDKPMLGGDASGVKVTIDKVTGLLATEATPPELREEKIFKQAHSILHYVNRSDPLGPIPSDPSQDEYYSSWESAVADWAKENGITNELPPAESDNLHRAGDQPSVSWSSPGDNQTIAGESVALRINAFAPRGVQRVAYFIDNNPVGTSYQNPYDYDLTIPPIILNGQHTLTAKTYDDLGNVGQASVIINLQRKNYLNIGWLEPSQSTALSASDFPLNLMINVDDLSKVKKVDFYYRPENSQSSTWINYLESPATNNIDVLWSSAPPNGVYQIYPVLTNWQGQLINGPEITISLE